jgi:hypothetical protein
MLPQHQYNDDEFIVDPSFATKENIETFLSVAPDTTIYVPVLSRLSIGLSRDLPAKHGYTSERLAKTHWWFRDKDNKQYTTLNKMTMHDFVYTTDSSGMNPFETINRMQVLGAWKNKYSTRKED